MANLNMEDFIIVNGILKKNNIKYTKITRYETGYCHRVFYVKGLENEYVIRVSEHQAKDYYLGSLEWIPALYDLGLPVPKILDHGDYYDIHYTIMTYLKGKDLGEVYHLLSDNQKRQLAQAIVKIQSTVSTLPSKGYYGSSVGTHYKQWIDVLMELITRSQNRIRRNDIFDESYCSRVTDLLPNFTDYFTSIKSTPFLNDITTKNVMVLDGKLAGIVDIDEMFYGDSLSTIALTNMALLSDDLDTEYIEDWLNEIHADEIQRKVVLFYTLIFCIDFMGEQGMTFFNGVYVYDEVKIKRLKKIYNTLMSQLNNE